MAGKKNPRLYLATMVLLVASLAVGTALSEGAYRTYLYFTKAPDRFVRPISGALNVYAEPFWKFDKTFGYTYPKGNPIHSSSITDGRVTGCSTWENFNARGNIGPIRGDYGNADLKILMFGDSFTATIQNGETYSSLLQKVLSRRLGKKVHVVNFGRDGTGILQMFDMAAAKVPEWKPDLAVISFITNDLQRIRFWRTVTKVDGIWRYLVSPEPTPDPDPLISYDTGLYHPEATAEWCRKMKESGAIDRVIAEIEKAYQAGVNVGGSRTADILSLRHSYLFARLLHGDPFHGLPGFFAFPVVQYKSYGEDARFKESLKKVQASKIPFALFHLAFYPEIKEGKEYIMNYQEQSLLKSLKEATGQEVLETTKHISMPLEKPERMNQFPQNYHPSYFGIELYANAIAEALIRNGLVK